MTSTPQGGQPPAAPTRRGLFARIRDWFRGRGEQRPPVGATPSDSAVSERRRADHPLRVPADGGVFEFSVHYEVIWSAKGMSRSTLADRIAAYADSAALSVRSTIWPVGRRFLPHHPEAAENAMNESLREGWCYDDHGEVVSCRVTVQVSADERVVANQLPLWNRLVEMDLRLRVERRRVDYVDDLLTRWRDLLEKFGDSPVVTQAARLVETEFAAVARGLADERSASALDLARVLRDAGNAHEHVGLYEFANAYDTALRVFERRAGLVPGTVTLDSEDGGNARNNGSAGSDNSGYTTDSGPEDR